MTSNDRSESTPADLTPLAILAADPARAERTRRRCIALLAREHRRREPTRSRVEIARSGLGALILGVVCLFCVVYVSALAATAFRVQGLLR